MLVTVDALRADHLSLYGYPRLTSPQIDAFSERASVFSNAITQAPYTKAAVASLMSGLYPTSHKALTTTVPFAETMTGRPITPAVATDVLDSSLTTLAERFQSAGYQTFGYTANPFLIAPFGFAQGFDTFEFFPGTDFAEDSAVVDRAMADVDRAGPGPLFLWIHLMEPHSPYDPPAWTREMFPPQGRPEPIGGRRPPPAWLLKNSPDDLRLYESRYDEDIAAADIAIGHLFHHLAYGRGLKDSIVVITSDHGEEFLDHEGWEHGGTLHDELVRVPLVLRAPEVAPGRVDGQVQLIDVYSTLLELAGLPAPTDVAGRSFVDLLAGGRRSAPAFFEIPPGAYGVRADGWKLIAFPDGRRELYDLRTDPGERRDVARAQPGKSAALSHLIDRHLADAIARGAGVAHREIPVDARVLEQLRALGYVAR